MINSDGANHPSFIHKPADVGFLEVISSILRSCKTSTHIAWILQGHILTNALFKSHELSLVAVVGCSYCLISLSLVF